MEDAKKARQNAGTPFDRQEGLFPAHTEFHKSIIDIQVNYTLVHTIDTTDDEEPGNKHHFCTFIP